jgi:hypothetical protein
MSEHDIHEVEVSMQHAKKAIEMREDLQKLTSNPTFEKVLLKGYFEEEASRLVLLKAEPSMEDDKQQKQIMLGIDGIGALRQYFRTIMQLGSMAEKSLIDNEEMHAELLKQEAEV